MDIIKSLLTVFLLTTTRANCEQNYDYFLFENFALNEEVFNQEMSLVHLAKDLRENLVGIKEVRLFAT
jgi:hypothetical protein